MEAPTDKGPVSVSMLGRGSIVVVKVNLQLVMISSPLEASESYEYKVVRRLSRDIITSRVHILLNNTIARMPR